MRTDLSDEHWNEVEQGWLLGPDARRYSRRTTRTKRKDADRLIREGATLIQNVDDVMEAIRPLHVRPFRQPDRDYAGPYRDADASERERRTIADLLSPTAVPVDEIIRQAALAPAVVHTVLLELELAGRLERHAGGKVSIVA